MHDGNPDLRASVGHLRELLEQSAEGIHALFGPGIIHRALRAGFPRVKDEAVMKQRLDAVFTALAKLEDVSRQKALFDTLPAPIQDTVILLYLRMVDQVMQAEEAPLH